MKAATGMCPYCGEEVAVVGGLTDWHNDPDGTLCALGSRQIARCAESDARPLWNGQQNRRFAG